MKPIFKLTLILFLLFTVNSTLLTVHSFAAIPKIINYQGRLSDSQGKPLNGAYNITFRLYDTAGGGSPIWSETHTGVTVERGIFNATIGGVTPLDLSFDRQYYLAIQVGSDPEMAPRQPIASSAYALRANVANDALNSNKVNNIEASTTPQANKLLPLDANAKFPTSTLGLKVYDSGWFAIASNTTYTITHNLGDSEKCIIRVFQKKTDTGVIAVATDLHTGSGGDRYGYTICSLTNNSFKIRTSSAPIYYEDENGNYVATNVNAQYKVLVLSLI